MTRWMGAGLLVILTIVGVVAARRASAGPGANDFAAGTSQSPPSQGPAPAGSADS